MGKLLDSLMNREIKGKLTLESSDNLEVVTELIDEAKSKSVTLADLGEIVVDIDDDTYWAGFTKVVNNFGNYDMYLLAMNGTFVISPLTNPDSSHYRTALCCGSFAYDGDGNTMIARVRIRFNTQSKNLTIRFDSNFAEQLNSSGITPKGYLFGIKL